MNPRQSQNEQKIHFVNPFSSNEAKNRKICDAQKRMYFPFLFSFLVGKMPKLLSTQLHITYRKFNEMPLNLNGCVSFKQMFSFHFFFFFFLKMISQINEIIPLFCLFMKMSTKKNRKNVAFKVVRQTAAYRKFPRKLYLIIIIIIIIIFTHMALC